MFKFVFVVIFVGDFFLTQLCHLSTKSDYKGRKIMCYFAKGSVFKPIMLLNMG